MIMWKSDFQVLVPFVKSTEKYDCSFSKEVNPKHRQVVTVSKKQGKDIRKFYEDLVNSDESISPWSDTIQKKNSTTESESLAYSTNDGKSSSKRKSLERCSKTQVETSSSSSSTTTYTNPSGFGSGDYEVKLNTTIASELLDYITNNDKSSTCLKGYSGDYSSFPKTKKHHQIPTSTSASTDTNCSIFRHGDKYKTKPDITVRSEPLPHGVNNGKSSPYLKWKNLDYSASSKKQVITSTTSTLPCTNSSERECYYKTKFNTTITSESLDYSTNNGNRRNYLRNEPGSVSSKTQAVDISSTSATTNSISSIFERCDNYDKPKLDTIEKPLKTKVDTIEMPSNSKPLICRNTDDIIKKFSQEHIQNSVLRCAQEGDLPGLKQHLKSGSVDVNCTDSFGWTPLMCASFSGHIDVVKFLLSLDGVDDRYRNRKGQSALGLSVKGGHGHIKNLLENHCRYPPVSPSPSCRKEEAHVKCRYQNQSSTSEYFCDVCQMQVRNTTKSAHESSTVHLLNIHPKPLPESYFLSEQNRGFQIMVRTGWDESKGLGPSGEGRRIPVKTVLKRDRKGLGVKSSNVARVSHFDARDTKAVIHRQSRVIKSLNKKKLASIQRREKRKERYIRRCLDFN